jgi:hypothetical protein
MSRELDLARQLVKELEEKEQNEKRVQLSELAPGSRFTSEKGFGPFIVLEQDADCTKVIMENPYIESVKFDDNTCDYTKSSLRNMFDVEITSVFEREFGRNNLVAHTISLKSVDMQDYGDLTCKVRPITFDEARMFNNLVVNKDLPDWYWTCTPWSTPERGWKYSVAVVAPSGSINDINFGCSRGVRPFCILKSNIFVSKED